MQSVSFNICSIDEERSIVDMTRKSVEFFKEHRIRITWPKTSVEEEYNKNEYVSFSKSLEEHWLKEGNVFLDRLITFFRLEHSPSFLIKITNYGPMGFYHEPDWTIFINRNNVNQAIRTIKHEMIHLLMEPFIRKYHIPHTQKETIVNTILGWMEEGLSPKDKTGRK